MSERRTLEGAGSDGFAGGMMAALLAIILVVVFVLAVAVLWQPWAAGDGGVDVNVPTPTNYHLTPLDYGLVI